MTLLSVEIHGIGVRKRREDLGWGGEEWLWRRGRGEGGVEGACRDLEKEGSGGRVEKYTFVGLFIINAIGSPRWLSSFSLINGILCEFWLAENCV